MRDEHVSDLQGDNVREFLPRRLVGIDEIVCNNRQKSTSITLAKLAQVMERYIASKSATKYVLTNVCIGTGR